ncbi:MAG: 23S rRNA (uracil(1939)-C(5))-methyltransferase RlmD [Bacteroidetes bacterium]|nr:23S rRNA (uracil(1939)-C(5))-methyltransferase RlmD [Bacteroidota bacterium]
MGKKNQERKIWQDVAIQGMSAEGKGISKIDGKVIFTGLSVPGDVADIELRKSRKNYSEAVIKELKQSSALRTEPVCSHFGVCGGCKWQHIDYNAQLQFKKQIVEDAFSRIGKIEFPPIPDVLGAENNFYYRNKLEFTFTDRRWLTEEEINSGATFEHRNALGFHVPDSFSGVIDIDRCYLQADPSNSIRLAVKEFAVQNGYTFFNLKAQNGLLRNLLIRTTTTGELLVLISFFEKDETKIYALLDFLMAEFPEITSLQYVINSKRNDTIYDLDTIVYKGKDHITERLGDYQFKIGPKSFFQTNSVQAKRLYDITKDFAGLKEGDVVYDLYTGVGSIAIYVSGSCKKVVGIEQIAAAIEDAKENAKMNGVVNCSFYAGDVRMVLQDDFIKANGKPDVVITDPPRAGMHDDVIKTLLGLEAPRIVYVSCNPATQARDLQLLSEKYKVTRVQPVDMFPHTTHIENVVRLELK